MIYVLYVHRSVHSLMLQYVCIVLLSVIGKYLASGHLQTVYIYVIDESVIRSTIHFTTLLKLACAYLDLSTYISESIIRVSLLVPLLLKDVYDH